MISIFKPLLYIVAFGYLGFGVYLFLFQHRFVYFPEKQIHHNPSDVGLAYEEINFQSRDHVRLSGWFIPAENPKGTILFCHGNAGNMGDRLGTMTKCHELGFNFFIFDYRGYGKSEGKLSEAGTYHDALGAWNYLINKKGETPDKIIIYGRSLGAGVASWLATQVKPACLIIEAAFTSVQDIGAETYPFFPVRFLSRFHYPTKKNLSKVDTPVLVLHSTDDTVIPFHHGEKLFAAAKEPKAFVKMAGEHANGFLVSGKIYDDGIRAFLQEHYPHY